MNLKKVTKELFINPESIQFIRITGDYSYSIHFGGDKFLEFTIKDESILAVDYVKDELIPLLKESANE